ncbi:MAG: Crp/Fnr family transcriptional regulator [bacterium]
MGNKLFDFIARYMELVEEEKQAITDLAIFKSFKKGTVLVKEGEYSIDNYFVLEGCIRSYYVIDGEEKTNAFYTESESFAPLCSVNKQPSEYYVACVEDCLLAVANANMEAIIFEKFPRFETLCRILSEELLAKNQTSFDDFKNSTPEQRYLSLLKNRPDLIKRVPQHQIASYLGITRESLSRIRRRLATQKT